MTHILDLGKSAVLGRIQGLNRKHRLRTKHFDSVQWPAGLSIEVLDADAMSSLDHYPCVDQVFMVSQKLSEVIQQLDPEVEVQPVSAGEATVYLVMPASDSDVMYASAETSYSTNGYQLKSTAEIHADEEPDALFCNVRNTGLLAISDAFVVAAGNAGVKWSLVQSISPYEPMRDHPYVIMGTGNKAAAVEKLEATSAWPEVLPVGHPLGRNASDDAFSKDPDQAWASLMDHDDVEKRCISRFCSGLKLPELRGELDNSFAKSKLKKRWKETLAAKTADVSGLLVISQTTREVFEAAGVEADYQAFSISDSALDEERDDLWVVHPRHVVPWVDWSKSDVGLRWNGLMDEFFDLHPTEESYQSSLPLVRVEGSGLVLVRKDLAALLTRADGFHMTPLEERAVALNLDDSYKS